MKNSNNVISFAEAKEKREANSIKQAQNEFKQRTVDVLDEQVDYGEVLAEAQKILEQANIEKQLAEMFNGINKLNSTPVDNTIRLREAVLAGSMNSAPENNTIQLAA